ncbi:NeuD/PglB/VioB family sugar acetyltransferase [Pseudomethylobacillus aquaticus]|uniref:NeuD/PglB/VioB family sugar acetyltransferase n=1 Tax=Pseudomethylobacillus aquaticus TaxID=2676064 RepID=UPI00138FAE99|nr:NeuD/PglB/VioB family sugar acetyltransferase [Pseudomethylobacillus aquaticus]
MKLVIVGGSSFGLTVAEIARRTKAFAVEGYIDDSPEKLPSYSASIYWGTTDSLSVKKIGSKKLFVAVGNNASRRNLIQHIISLGLESSLVTLIDPAAVLLGDVSIGLGSVVFPGAVIGPHANLSKGVVVNAHSFIGAMSDIGAFSNICPGVTVGSCTSIGENAYIGMRASIIQSLKIASNTVIGAGASVVNDIDFSGTYAGIPARQISLN